MWLVSKYNLYAPLGKNEVIKTLLEEGHIYNGDVHDDNLYYHGHEKL